MNEKERKERAAAVDELNRLSKLLGRETPVKVDPKSTAFEIWVEVGYAESTCERRGIDFEKHN